MSHAELEFMGSLALIINELDPACPVFTTLPNQYFTKAVLYEYYFSLKNTYGLDESDAESHILKHIKPPFSLADVDKLLDRIVPLRYFQTVRLFSSKAKGVTIIPYPSGHSVGGALWRIKKGEIDDILYAVGFNHKKDAICDGAKFGALEFRPSLMIVDSRNALITGGSRQAKTSALLEAFSALVLDKKGSTSRVLLPLSSPSRIIEAAFLLDQHYRALKASKSRPRDAAIVILSASGIDLLEIAKGLLEWMGQSITDSFDAQKSSPFEFESAFFCRSASDLSRFQGPLFVIAPSETLDDGISREVLLEWAAFPDFHLYLARRLPPTTFSSCLLSGLSSGGYRCVLRKRLDLQEDDLRSYYKEQDDLRALRIAEVAFQKLRQLKSEAPEDSIEVDAAGEGDFLTETGAGLYVNSATMLKDVLWVEFRRDLTISKEAPFSTLSASNPAQFKKYACNFTFNSHSENKLASKYTSYGLSVDPIGAVQEHGGAKPSVPQERSSVSKETEHVPYRWITSVTDFDIKVKARLLDFDSLSDGRSVKTIVSSINPRKVVFIGGLLEERQHYANFFSLPSNSFTGEVFSAENFVPINCSSSLLINQAVLDEALLTNLTFTCMDEYNLAQIKAAYGPDSGPSASEEQGSLLFNESDAQRHEIVACKDEPREPILIGDPKLSEIKKSLHDSCGISGEIVAGELYIKNVLRFKKVHHLAYLLCNRWRPPRTFVRASFRKIFFPLAGFCSTP